MNRNSNKEAIKAAQELSAETNIDIEHYAEFLVHREQIYKTVQIEHQRQISSIGIPDVVVPRKLPLNWRQRLFLWYMDGKRVDVKNIAVYWYIEYGLYDYQACIKHLFDGGYLTYANPADSLDALSARDLQDILRNANLPTSGTKSALCKRILSSVSREHINSTFPHLSTFRSTQLGKELLAESSAIIYYHQNRMKIPVHLEFQNIEKAAKKYPHLSDEQLIWMLTAAKDKRIFMARFRDLDCDSKKIVFDYAISLMKNKRQVCT